MNKVIKYLFISSIILSTINFGFCVDSEYKNSLSKIELTKTNDGSYNVDLYTQKKYSEPVKIIKKNDLNYYILLPETKNTASSTITNSNDIKNISTKLYPYAGQDINNGYTKININTTKPVNFNVNVRNLSEKQSQTKSSLKLTQAEPKTQVQKKNITSKTNNKKENNEIVGVAAAAKIDISKGASKNKISIKPKINEVKKQTKTNIKKITNVSKMSTKTTSSQPQKVKPTPIKQTPVVQKEKPVQNFDNLENSMDYTIQEQQKEILKQEAIQEADKLEEELLKDTEQNQPLKEETTAKQTSLAKKGESLTHNYLSKIKHGISKLNLKALFIAFLTAIVSFIASFFVLSKTASKTQPRLSKKSELFDKTKETIKPKEEPKKENNGQFFIFDDGIKQTGFCEPSSKEPVKNYELTSYEPDIKKNYEENKIEAFNEEKNEYDIIQKILRDDDFIDIANEKTSKKQISNENIKEEISQQEEEKKKTPEELKNATNAIEASIPQPVVLSRVEVAPEKGFMCVSYNNTINLMGYIFDDVFALSDFKVPKLENYDIKYRISDKDLDGAEFIVKISEYKMLIRVSNSSMKLEVMM